MLPLDVDTEGLSFRRVFSLVCLIYTGTAVRLIPINNRLIKGPLMPRLSLQLKVGQMQKATLVFSPTHIQNAHFSLRRHVQYRLHTPQIGKVRLVLASPCRDHSESRLFYSNRAVIKVCLDCTVRPRFDDRIRLYARRLSSPCPTKAAPKPKRTESLKAP